MSAGMAWYVLQVHTLHELDVRDDLLAAGYHAAVPREMTLERHGGVWRERERMFFPGYVFAQLTMSDKDYYALRGMEHVLRILGQPTPLPEDEALYIEMLTITPEPLDQSRGVLDGNRLRIVSGPLIGKEGWIIKLDQRQRRARVRLRILNEIHDINMSLIILQR